MTVAADWRARAACRSADPDLFYPDGTGFLSQRQTSTAKTFCRECPVVDACLAAALAVGESHGIWGGLSAYERKHRRRPAAGTWRGSRLA